MAPPTTEPHGEGEALEVLFILARARGQRGLTPGEARSLEGVETWLRENTDGMRMPGSRREESTR